MDLAIGTCAALASNASWIVGATLFSRYLKGASPLGMNLGRGLFTLGYLGLALLLLGGWSPLSPESFYRLGLSGLLGMAIGDSLFFAALLRLGPRLTMLLGMAGPVFSVALGVGVLHERLGLLDGIGMLLILLGVAGVVLHSPSEDRALRWSGVVFSLLGSLAMALGSLLAKEALVVVAPLQAAFVRMLWSVLLLSLVGLTRGKLSVWLRPFAQARLQGAIVLVVFGGFFLSMLALRLLPLSVAALLTASEPLLALVITAALLRQPIGRPEGLSVLIGFVGVLLLALP